MRSLRYYRRTDADAQKFTLGYAYSLGMAFGNTLTAYIHSNDLPTRVNQLSFGITSDGSSSDLSSGAWIEWATKVRQSVKNGMLPSRLTARLDDIGRAGFITSSKSAGETALFDEFHPTLEMGAAVHQPVPSWSQHVLSHLVKSKSVEAHVVYQPAYVTPKVFVKPAEIDAGTASDLFRSPTLNQKFCTDVIVATTVVDSVRWNNAMLSVFCDAKTIEGVSMQMRANWDLITKRTQLKGGIILWLLYELQPLIAYANFVLPLYRRIQAKNAEIYGEEDDGVRRAAKIISSVEQIAALPLHELWSPAVAVNRSPVSVDSIFGESEGWFIPGIHAGGVDADGDVEIAHGLESGHLPYVERDKTLRDVHDEKSVLSYVELLRTVAFEKYNTVDTNSGLWPFEHVKTDSGAENRPIRWIDWRTLAMCLANLVGLAELVKMKEQLGWTTGVSTVGEIKIDNRGSDFALTDTDGYQKNVWQVFLGITPSLAICNSAVYKHYLDSDLSFGKGSNRVRWSVISFGGHFGDFRSNSSVERHFIPACSSCDEVGSEIRLGVKRNQPNVVAYYKGIFPNGIATPLYETTAPKAGATSYHQDSWDGWFSSAISSVGELQAVQKTIAAAIGKQYEGSLTGAEECRYAYSKAGFNKRSPVHFARASRCVIISNYYDAFALVEDNCSVTWDERDEEEAQVSASSCDPVTSFLDMHIGAIEAEVKGGYSVSIAEFVDSE